MLQHSPSEFPAALRVFQDQSDVFRVLRAEGVHIIRAFCRQPQNFLGIGDALNWIPGFGNRNQESASQC